MDCEVRRQDLRLQLSNFSGDELQGIIAQHGRATVTFGIPAGGAFAQVNTE